MVLDGLQSGMNGSVSMEFSIIVFRWISVVEFDGVGLVKGVFGIVGGLILVSSSEVLGLFELLESKLLDCSGCWSAIGVVGMFLTGFGFSVMRIKGM